jgi:hypothetical protein
MSSMLSVPIYRNPILDGERRIAAASLHNWLLARNYAQNYREAICRHAIAEGTLAGLPDGHLDPEDVAAAEQVLVDGFEPVSYDEPAWGEDYDPDAGFIPPPVAVEPDDDFPDPTPDERWEGRTPRLMALPPISGGSPEEYVPTAEDLREYGEWSAQLDATRAWYERNSIEQFNASV